MKGKGYRVQGTGYRVQGTGYRVQDTGYRVQGTGYRVQGTGYRVKGTGYRVRDPHRTSFGISFGGPRTDVQPRQLQLWRRGTKIRYKARVPTHDLCWRLERYHMTTTNDYDNDYMTMTI